MGMQIHFDVTDIPEYWKVHKHADEQREENPENNWIDYYIVVDPESIYFSTDKDHKSAWFDCGGLHRDQMNKIKWLILNRIPFNAA